MRNTFNYATGIYTNKETDAKLTLNQFDVDFNNSSIYLNFYF